MKNTSLNGAVVAVTGGGRGIGLAIAQACAARGARVAIGDIDAPLAEQAAFALGGYGGSLDVRDRDSFNDFLCSVKHTLGPINVLINNAGIMPMGHFDQESDAISDAQIDINVRGVILGCKLAIAAMHEHGGGHIVNVASLAGVVPLPGAAVYCATKFAVRGLTHALREEYRDSGIEFSTILPSKINTQLASGTDHAGRGVPTSEPEDVAAAVIDAIEQRLPEVTVPRYLRSVPALWAGIPHQIERLFRRAFGDQRMLNDLDLTARADYNHRMNTLSRAGD